MAISVHKTLSDVTLLHNIIRYYLRDLLPRLCLLCNFAGPSDFFVIFFVIFFFYVRLYSIL